MFTFWNYYILKLLRLETISLSDATLSDINFCFMLRFVAVPNERLKMCFIIAGANALRSLAKPMPALIADWPWPKSIVSYSKRKSKTNCFFVWKFDHWSFVFVSWKAGAFWQKNKNNNQAWCGKINGRPQSFSVLLSGRVIVFVGNFKLISPVIIQHAYMYLPAHICFLKYSTLYADVHQYLCVHFWKG